MTGIAASSGVWDTLNVWTGFKPLAYVNNKPYVLLDGANERARIMRLDFSGFNVFMVGDWGKKKLEVTADKIYVLGTMTLLEGSKFVGILVTPTAEILREVWERSVIEAFMQKNHRNLSVTLSSMVSATLSPMVYSQFTAVAPAPVRGGNPF